MTQTPDNLAPIPRRLLAAVGGPAGSLPSLFLRSAHSGKCFWEFFTANIRNRNTRRAYFIAVSQFSAWCEERKLSLDQVQPIHVAAYIEEMGKEHSKPTVKPLLSKTGRTCSVPC